MASDNRIAVVVMLTEEGAEASTRFGHKAHREGDTYAHNRNVNHFIDAIRHALEHRGESQVFYVRQDGSGQPLIEDSDLTQEPMFDDDIRVLVIPIEEKP